MTYTVPGRSARQVLSLLAAAALTVVVVGVSLGVGMYDISGQEFGAEMFWITRVPRTLALVLSGSAMAVSGLVMQMITQNRFVEPTTAGTAEWAALGLLLTMMVAPTASIPVKMVTASLAALAGTVVFLVILQRIKVKTSLMVPLVGIMLGSVVSAATTYIAASTNLLQMIGTWFMGSFTAVVRGRYEILWVVALVLVLVYLGANRFTAVGLGSEMATSLGVNYNRTVFIGASLVAVATGVTTVVVGFLPFIGLVVPNVVSLTKGDNLHENLPWVALGGVFLVTLCDIIGRVIRIPFEIPVSLILGTVGAIVFLFLLLRSPGHG